MMCVRLNATQPYNFIRACLLHELNGFRLYWSRRDKLSIAILKWPQKMGPQHEHIKGVYTQF